ncbi:MAG: hypothetical protein IIY08_06090 [Cellulosilyticum sp.]|nr:hypothetical protein [Cellulosilyticum sp.]
MRQQTKCIEIPFNQLELAQLELFLNREREENWVLVKIEGNKFYFEVRPGKLYCYEVRLLMEPIGKEPNFLKIEERQHYFIKRQEEAGWYFVGELKDWHVFRSLVEKSPIATRRNWKEEYKQLKWRYLHCKLKNTGIKCGILLFLIMSIIMFSPLTIITSNYVLGLILTFMMVGILGILELNIWINYKYKMYKKLRRNMPFESNETLIKEATNRKRASSLIIALALLVFVLGMLIDGIFTKSLPIILMAILITGIFTVGYLEELDEDKWVKLNKDKQKVTYVICLIGIILTGIWNCIDNIERTYTGNEALKIKSRMQQLSLVTLNNPNVMNYTGDMEIIEKETRTIFLKHHLQYAEWQGDKYLSLNYYETWNSNWANQIFKFLLRAKKIDEQHGYQKIKPQWYGADEAYIEEYGTKICLRKGRYIIEIQSTSEQLENPVWQYKIRYKNKNLGSR